MNRETARSILFEFRVEKGLTQKQLSELAGISNKTLVDIERGNVIPIAGTLRKLKIFMDGYDGETEKEQR